MRRLLLVLWLALPLAAQTPLESGVLSGLRARNIGSAAMSGRISAIAGYARPDGKTTLYVGAADGGVWRSLDGGTTFKPVFDKEPCQSIGCLTLDPSNPKVLWVGTGESWTRNSVSIGAGIFRSSDEGQTFDFMGLPHSERISKIVVDPRSSQVVYAAVLGPLWSDSPERGLYKTQDGGKSWSLVLKGSNLSTGCAGLAMDPANPDHLLAGLWDFRRKGWTFRSGGSNPTAPSGSGLYQSLDGGKSWQQLTGGGLPPAPWGRVEVSFAPSDPQRVYAFIESPQSALYVSSDGGQSWEARDKSQWMVWRPFYFANLIVDPSNPDRLFKTDLDLIVSEDGGRSFASSGGGSHCDWHALWIDPKNPKHLIGGDDGGLWLSQDGGSRWWRGENLPISQFYHVAVDDQDPYQVYGGLQDNACWVGDSSYPGGISNSCWENLLYGDGFWTLPDPADPDYVYAECQGGYLARVNRKTHAARQIQPQAGYHEKLRFNWNTPLHLSSHDRGSLYIGCQYLLRTRDHGQTWERLSPDLTTNDPQKQKQEESGGVTVDNSVAEMHCTIYSICESPKNGQLIWVGTDDGNLQLTRDGGKSWTNLASRLGLPPASWISWVEASRYVEGTAYVAVDRHTFGDMQSYLLKTTDYGQSWQRLGPGPRGYAHVIREDTVSPRLLFAGTELGLWISLDGGASWAEFKGGNFPSVAVRDLTVQPRDGDLVVATHGRGMWILDDLSPLRQLARSPELLGQDLAFLPGRPIQQRMAGVGGWVEGDAHFVGDNPPSGAAINYYQRQRHVFGPLKLEILDSQGNLLDTLPASKRRGLNRVDWSMRVAPPKVPRAAQLAGASTQGPRVVPGTYKVRLTKGDKVYETTFQVGPDRRSGFLAEERQAQFEAAMRVHRLFGSMTSLVDRLEATKKLVLAVKPPDKALELFAGRVEDCRKKVVATKEGGAITGEERLREHADQLYDALLSYEGRPAAYLVDRIGVLERELAEVGQDFEGLLKSDLPGLNQDLKARGLPPLEPPPLQPAGPSGVSSADLDRAVRDFLGEGRYQVIHHAKKGRPQD